MGWHGMEREDGMRWEGGGEGEARAPEHENMSNEQIKRHIGRQH